MPSNRKKKQQVFQSIRFESVRLEIRMKSQNTPLPFRRKCQTKLISCDTKQKMKEDDIS